MTSAYLPTRQKPSIVELQESFSARPTSFLEDKIVGKVCIFLTSRALPSLVTMLPHSNGYSITPQPPQQQVYFYDHEEIQITPFNEALVDCGRPSSPMIGNPADNSIPFKVPKSIIDQINPARAVPPTPIYRRESYPGETDYARPPPGLPLPHLVIEEIRTIGHMIYDTTQKKSIFAP